VEHKTKIGLTLWWFFEGWGLAGFYGEFHHSECSFNEQFEKRAHSFIQNSKLLKLELSNSITFLSRV